MAGKVHRQPGRPAERKITSLENRCTQSRYFGLFRRSTASAPAKGQRGAGKPRTGSRRSQARGGGRSPPPRTPPPSKRLRRNQQAKLSACWLRFACLGGGFKGGGEFPSPFVFCLSVSPRGTFCSVFPWFSCRRPCRSLPKVSDRSSSCFEPKITR